MLEIKMEINDAGFKAYMRLALARSGNLTIPLKKCSIVMFRSFANNFKSEGRPSKWKPLSPNTIAHRRKSSSRILQDTGRLRMSVMSVNAPGNIFKLSKYQLVMGSNLKIAPWQQWGTEAYTITPKKFPMLRIPMADGISYRLRANHPGIPARPFILIQDEDVKEMEKIFLDTFLKG